VKNIVNALDSGDPGVTNWPVTTLHLVSHCWFGIGMWVYTPAGLTGVLVTFFISQQCKTMKKWANIFTALHDFCQLIISTDKISQQQSFVHRS